MHKNLMKLIVVVGGMLLITAWIWGVKPVMAKNSSNSSIILPTCSNCHPLAFAKTTFNQIHRTDVRLSANVEIFYSGCKAHSGIGIYCAACHNPESFYTTISTILGEQTQAHNQSDSIVKCTVCHMQDFKTAYSQLRGEE